MGYIRPDFPKLTSRISWLLIGGEHLRKNLRKASARVREGWARQGEKKAGRGGWGKARKKEGGVGRWMGDDVIKKIKNKK